MKPTFLTLEPEYEVSIEKKIQRIPDSEKQELRKILSRVVESAIENKEKENTTLSITF